MTELRVYEFATIQIVVQPEDARCVIHLITTRLSPCSSNRINAGYQVSALLLLSFFSHFEIHCYDDDERTVNGVYRIHRLLCHKRKYVFFRIS